MLPGCLTVDELQQRLNTLDERVDFYRFDSQIFMCETWGDVCRLEKGDACHKKMEDCVVAAHQEWKMIRKAKEDRGDINVTEGF